MARRARRRREALDSSINGAASIEGRLYQDIRFPSELVFREDRRNAQRISRLVTQRFNDYSNVRTANTSASTANNAATLPNVWIRLAEEASLFFARRISQ